MGKSIIASAVEHPHMRIRLSLRRSASRRLFVEPSITAPRREPREPSRSHRSKASKSHRTRRRASKSPRIRARPKQQAAGRVKQEIEQYREAAAKLSLTAGSAECVWTGRRITSLLWRDDMDTALRYIGLYDRFGCSAEHLKLAFRCMIRQGPMDPKAADRLAARVHDVLARSRGDTNRRG